jgi:hypothetical protein
MAMEQNIQQKKRGKKHLLTVVGAIEAGQQQAIICPIACYTVDSCMIPQEGESQSRMA